MPTDTTHIQDVLTRARAEVRKVIIGQEDVVDKALIAIFTGHHALIEGVPGVAKTLLVRTLARVLGCEASIRRLGTIVARGTSAHVQLAHYAQLRELGASRVEALRGVVDQLVETTVPTVAAHDAVALA